MNTPPEQQANEGPSSPALEFASFPSTTQRDREREALRQRKRRRLLLALFLGVCLAALGTWMSRPPERDTSSLPHVTLEVRGMS
jgi:hypothetical protein